jgi:hypothetical protein
MTMVDLQLTQSEKERIARGTGLVYKDAPCGRAGDIFTLDGKKYEIIDVCERSLNVVAKKYTVLGGYATIAEFVAAWEARHRSSCEPGMSLFIHWFRQI